MVKNYKSLIILSLCLLTSAYYIACSNDNKKHFLWEVKSGIGKVFLLGSIHIAKESMYPLDEVIENDFDSSSAIAVELDINSIDPFKVMQLGMYTDTGSLKNNVSDSIYQELSTEFEKYGLPKMTYDKFKPWFAILSVMGLEVMTDSAKPSLGIDEHFLMKAEDKKMKVYELESLEEQMNLLENAINEYSKEFVDYTLKDLEDMPDNLEQMFTVWQNGDTEAMDKLINDEVKDNPQYQKINEMLLYERNVKMVTKIEGYLNSGQTVFVIVGAGHLVGEKGIVSLLGKMNKYKIEQK